MKPNDHNEALVQKIEDVAKALSGDYDSIRIIATKHDSYDDDTHFYTAGYGNWHAQKESCRQFVKGSDDYELAYEIAKQSSH